MALAVDSEESTNTGHNAATGGTASTLTWSFTNTAGNLLIVAATVNQVGGSNAPSFGTVSYNGVAMTQIPSAVFTDTANHYISALYYLANPATGSNTVSVTGNPNGSPTYLDVIAGAISFSGASTSAPGNPVTNNGSGTSASATLTGTTNGDIIVALCTNGTGVTSMTSPNTKSWLKNVGGADASDNAGLGRDATSGGSITPTFVTSNDIWSVVAAEISPPAAASAKGNVFIGM